MRATSDHEALVASRFDALRDRFADRVAPDDYRLTAILEALGPSAGGRVLDLGCGKGRFARRLAERGAEVVGLDLSAGMLAEARGLDRALGSAARLPFAAESFDGAYAVEVLQHLTPASVTAALLELRRVLKPGGRLAIVDRNAGALDARRPWLPRVVVKWIDEYRGRWMYRPGESARERWFRPGKIHRKLSKFFARTRVEFLIAPDEACRAVFRLVPAVRSMTLWTAEAPGGSP